MTRPQVVVLNGPPGVGKSTVAALLADRRPRTAVLDLDLIKHTLPEWPRDPYAAGLRARRAALGIASRHLTEGHDVVLGQYLARPEFLDQLAELAATHEAASVEVMLLLSESDLATRLAGRRDAPDRSEHAVNAPLTPPEDAGQLLASRREILEARPWTTCVDATGTPTDVVRRVETLLPTSGGSATHRHRPGRR